MSRTLPKIFKEEEGAEETKGENARLSAYVGAIAVADLVKTTLGPKGMDKILQSTDRQEKCIFTNDGATILKSVPVDNPAAKIIVDMSKTQDSEVGDGTTSVAVLAGEILREAEKLVTLKIHPQTIIRGWRKAVAVARKALEDASLDHSDDKEQFRQDLLNVARTTLSSKILSSYKDHFANLCVDAVLRLKGSNDLERIQILKKAGAGLKDSYLEEGFILDAKRSGVGQPKRLENARILLANTALDTDKIKVHGATVRVDSVAKVAEIEKAEKKKMQEKVAKIIAHDINCFISRQLIYNLPEQIFTEHKIMAIEHADFEGIERLAFVLGGEITSTFDDPKRVRLGTCKLIEETQIGEDQVIRFRGCGQGEACTIVIRAASEHILDEAERSLHDVLCVLIQTISSNKIVYGGGWSEILMGKAVDEEAQRTAGKEQIVIESFARALRALPAIIADNAGFDSIELVSQLRAAHGEEKSRAGINIEEGTVGDMEKLAVIESLRAKMMVLVSAHEAAEMILRVDEIIKAAPRKRRAKGHGH